MKTNPIIIFSCVTALASCNGQDIPSQQANTVKSTKFISKDIRTDTANIWNNFYNVRELSRQLKLEPIEDGFDSLQIRIWFDHSMAWKKQVIVIERRKSEWKGGLYELNVGYVDTLNYNLIEQYSKKNIVPTSGWKELINELNHFKIQELSDTGGTGADGMTYSVEILTAGTYTYYSFWEPEFTRDRNGQSANMLNIISLLKREFRLNSIK